MTWREAWNDAIESIVASKAFFIEFAIFGFCFFVVTGGLALVCYYLDKTFGG